MDLKERITIPHTHVLLDHALCPTLPRPAPPCHSMAGCLLHSCPTLSCWECGSCCCPCLQYTFTVTLLKTTLRFAALSRSSPHPDVRFYGLLPDAQAGPCCRLLCLSACLPALPAVPALPVQCSACCVGSACSACCPCLAGSARQGVAGRAHTSKPQPQSVPKRLLLLAPCIQERSGWRGLQVQGWF